MLKCVRQKYYHHSDVSESDTSELAVILFRMRSHPHMQQKRNGEGERERVSERERERGSTTLGACARTRVIRDRNRIKILKTTAPARLLADIGSAGLLFSIIKSQVPVRRCAPKYCKPLHSCCILRHRHATSACRCSLPARFQNSKHASTTR